MIREVMIPLPKETIVGEVSRVTPISGAYNVPEGILHGKLVYTNYRVAFMGSKHRGETYYFMVPYEKLLSLNITEEKALFGLRKSKRLMIHYETTEGIVRKVYFKLPWDTPNDIISDITAVMKRAKESRYHEELLSPQEFKEFVMFLYSEKGISPLYHDPVSRAIRIGNATFYIKRDFTVGGDSHILPDAKRWIEEFRSVRR